MGCHIAIGLRGWPLRPVAMKRLVAVVPSNVTRRFTLCRYQSSFDGKCATRWRLSAAWGVLPSRHLERVSSAGGCRETLEMVYRVERDMSRPPSLVASSGAGSGTSGLDVGWFSVASAFGGST